MNIGKNKTFGWWQWRMIIVTMIGYALFYLVRKNFALAMPGLQSEFGISKVQLGLFLTLNGVVYGLSRFVNGILTDRGSAKKIMSIGLLCCALVNILFGCSDLGTNLIMGLAAKMGIELTFTTVLVYFMGIVWVINGYLQGMGVPPCTKIMSKWVHPNELATKMSIWNMSHSIGAGLAFALCGWLIMPYLGWRWCFIIPAIICIVGSFYLMFALKNSPSDVNFPEVVGKKQSTNPTPEEKAEHSAFVRKHVFANRIIWTLAFANFFVYIIRFAALDWGPTLLTEARGVSLAVATTICFVFEIIGGNLGMIFWGWATDKFFHNKAHHTCVICMFGAALCFAIFMIMPTSAPWWLMMIPYAFLGFCIYGPQALLGICAAQHATNKAAATANGILGIFGYASTIISGVGFGYVAHNYGWESAYIIIIAASLLGALTMLTIWKAKANGYDEEELKNA